MISANYELEEYYYHLFPKEIADVLIENPKMISRIGLAKLFNVHECTVRDAVDIQPLAMVRRRPIMYRESDAIEFLKMLNDGQNVWSSQFLSTKNVASLLSDRLPKKVSENSLIKRRKTGYGPNWVFVTNTAVRYRIEDIESWIAKRQCIPD